MALRLPEGGLLAERGWDEVGGREPGKNNKKQVSTLFIKYPGAFSVKVSEIH